MRNLTIYLKKLKMVTGPKIYMNIFLSIFISAIEGISIYLLVPMLAVIGLFEASISNVFPLNVLVKGLEQLPFTLNLPFILVLYFMLLTGQALLQRYQTILNTEIQQNFIRYLRVETYESLIKAKWEYYLEKRKSDFNYILTTEISRVGIGTHGIIQLIGIVFFTIVQVTLAFLLSPSLTLVVMVCGAVIAIYMRKFVKGSKVLGKETTELMSNYFGGISEQFNGMKDMKSNRLESSFNEWFQSMSNRIHQNVMKLVKLNSKSTFIYRVAAGLLIIFFVSLVLH